MSINPVYQPEYYGAGRNVREPSRYDARDGYMSEDNLDTGSRIQRYPDGHDRRRGRDARGYHSDTECRREDRPRVNHKGGDRYRYDDLYRHDNPHCYEDRYRRGDPRHYPEDHYRDYPIRPYHGPRDDPYYYHSRDMFNPVFIPERYPRGPPKFCYADDMRRRPHYMYDSTDMYNSDYGSGEYFMEPPRGQHQRKRPAEVKSETRQVDFDEDVEEQTFDPNEVDPHLIQEIQESKLRVRKWLLLIVILFLCATVILGAVATALDPWWTQQTKDGSTSFESIKVGLWRTCARPNSASLWVCHQYSEESFESPYESITLLQWSMIVGSIASFIALAFVVLAICGKSSKYLLGLLCTIIFFNIGSTVLFGLVIAYVNEDRKARKIVGSWTKNASVDLQTSTMFSIGCAATATSGFALIITFVIGFIYEREPEIKVAEEIVENGNETVENIRTIESNTEENTKRRERNTTDKRELKKVTTPTRKGTKYIRNDAKKERKPNVDDRGGKSQTNGHVKVVYKEPVIVPKAQQKTTVKVTHPKQMQPPRQSGHTMQPRQSYPPKGIPQKDYGNISGHPRQTQQSKGNKNVPRTQQNTMANPNALESPAAKNHKQMPLYDGDYDKYFNQPY